MPTSWYHIRRQLEETSQKIAHHSVSLLIDSFQLLYRYNRGMWMILSYFQMRLLGSLLHNKLI
ncbi:hypothetical protein BDB01DRAFT_802805 [Pilobolus umbonatus]|nr:hypothetical protein BDB01DRAFT_802805 [Pilobolus umbonatus]